MKRYLQFLCFAAAFAVFPISASATVLSAISFTSYPGIANQDLNIGWTFRAQGKLRVIGLGYYDIGQDGFAEPHSVGIFRLQDAALLASANLAAGTAAPLVDGFRYSISANPIIILGPGDYALMANNPGADAWTGLVGGFSVSPGVTFGTGVYSFGGSALQAPTNTSTVFDPGLFGPNMLLQVPEPSSFILLGAGVFGCVIVEAFAKRRSPARL